MKSVHAVFIAAILAMACFITACGGVDEASIEEIARKVAQEEDIKARDDFLKEFAPDNFGFGGALEKEWSHAQGCRVGNFIFVSGQQPYDTNLDDKGMPLTDLETGRNFEQQLTTCLENVSRKCSLITVQARTMLSCYRVSSTFRPERTRLISAMRQESSRNSSQMRNSR